MISATRLFVGNLPKNTEVNDLHSAFSVFGKITNLDLKSKPGDDNVNKKFAFVSLSADNPSVESCKYDSLVTAETPDKLFILFKTFPKLT